MTFTFPKFALPPKRTPLEIVRDHLAMMDSRDALRSVYRKARESEKAKADQITQAWRAEAEARTAEQAAKTRDDEAIDDNAVG